MPTRSRITRNTRTTTPEKPSVPSTKTNLAGSNSQARRVPIDARALEQLLADPATIKGLLDFEFDDVDDSPYRRAYATARLAALKQCGPGAVQVAALLDGTDDGVEAEEAIRTAGFVQGFECCRRLLRGELDLRDLGRIRALTVGRRL